MSIKDLNVIHRNKSSELPEWIQFAFEMGVYLNEQGIKYKKPASILLSLPSEQYFSLFVAMGIANKRFSTNKQIRSIRKVILGLGKGSRIIYQDNESARKASVVAIEPSPVFKGEMMLIIKDGKIERGIPENQWLDKIRVLDEEFDEVKRTRKVSKKMQLGLENNPLLRKLYSSNQLTKAEFYTGNYFYIVGNLANINSWIGDEIFTSEHVKGSIGDFLYLNNSNSYTNGKLFSSQMKKPDVDMSVEVPVIYSDLNGYLKQGKHFSNNPKLVIASRTDSPTRILEVHEEVKRELLLGKQAIITEELIEHFRIAEVKIPTGIEFIAWR
ncbi:hypothetical protein ACERJO_20270 [Halalkalibacter sp. AB-rgal2]|uniref:hypothetical protein n=1 Tax=Halalkalibacter sp. AB-rgal2 TaxID=3242695 RepID=UPI00359EB8C6